MHGLSAVPVSIFWTPLRVGNAAAAAGMVIVIISSLWSLKLRAQKWVGPGLFLPSPGVPKSRPVQPDIFPVRFPPCSLEACSEMHCLLGTRTGCVGGAAVSGTAGLCLRSLFAHLSPEGSQSRASDCVFPGHLRSGFSSGIGDGAIWA